VLKTSLMNLALSERYSALLRHYRPTLALGVGLTVLVLVLAGLREWKQHEMTEALASVELRDVQVGVGAGGDQLGTGVFGILENHGQRTISEATLRVDFINADGEVSASHKFFPINRWSFEDPRRFHPGDVRDFGFLIDDIVPEDWSGQVEAELIHLNYQ